MIPPLLELSSIVKSYGGLRPLRIERLLLAPDERVAIVGIDQAGAEVFVNLITGATLPEQGRVVLFGRASDAIATSDEWLALVDRFGIVSARAVLLDGLSVAQNLAVPFSLDIEPLGDELRARAVGLGVEAGLAPTLWDQPASALGASDRLRLRLARGLALDPSIVLLEHPSADVETNDRAVLGKAVRAVLAARRAAAIVLTSDQTFAVSFADRVLNFDPASGRLSERRRGWFGFPRGAAASKK